MIYSVIVYLVMVLITFCLIKYLGGKYTRSRTYHDGYENFHEVADDIPWFWSGLWILYYGALASLFCYNVLLRVFMPLGQKTKNAGIASAAKEKRQS